MESRVLLALGVSLLAMALAAARFVGWLGAGAWASRGVRDPVAAPLGIVVGAALTAACYAMASLLGHPGVGLGLDGVMAVISVAWNRRVVGGQLRDLRAQWLELAHTGRWTPRLAVVWLVAAWIAAGAPPRDADVLRYHLAHVRQIVVEGGWTRVADTAYALPFGWSLTYLPFEYLHIAPAAQMLNLGAWVMVVLALYRALDARASVSIRLLLLVVACQPLVFKAATTAHADVYVMLLMTVVGLLLVQGCALTTRDAALLGFVSWIGAQSRYQAIGIGLAAAATVAVAVGRGELRPRVLAAVAGGGMIAVALAAPFYAVNLRWFGDPVWPLLVSPHGTTAADRVALVLAERTSAPLAMGWLPRGLFRLAIDVTVFPIPWLTAAAVAAGWYTPRTRLLATFTTCYVVLWVLVQPFLFPRFVLFLVPLVPLLSADALRRVAGGPPAAGRWAIALLATCAAGLAVLTLASSTDALRYAATGDRARYERTTWFAPVFRWANATTPSTARFLVIVKSGMSYALERPYRRADPEGSAEIDWLLIPDARSLVDRLRADGFQYVIYEDRDWSRYPGGVEMARLIHEAIGQGLLVPVQRFDLRLVTSRLLDRWVPTTVIVLQRR